MGFTMFFTIWRTAFLIFIPIILILFFILRGVKKEWTTEKQKIDNLGSLIYVVTMGLLAYGITILDEWGIVLVIASIFLLILFVKVEKRAKHPIYNLKLLKDVRYVIGNYAAMAAYFTTTITFNAITFYLLYVEDYSEYFIGLILLIAPIIMVGLSGFSGRLTKRVDPRIISGVAMAFIFTSMILYAFMDHFELEYLIFACIL